MNVSRRDFVTTSGLAAVAIASQPISGNAQAQPTAPSLVASELGPNKLLQIASLDDVENKARGVLLSRMAQATNGPCGKIAGPSTIFRSPHIGCVV
jgi:hypothetical protein